MMVGDCLYFAPGIRFVDLDLAGSGLPRQFQSRMEGFYLCPGERMANEGYAFASCLLAVACIDGLAFFETGSTDVKRRFRKWCLANLKQLVNDHNADDFYDAFRNGLVHQVSVKRGGVLDLEQHTAIEFREGIPFVNPRRLILEVRRVLMDYVCRMEEQAALRKALEGQIRKTFEIELANA